MKRIKEFFKKKSNWPNIIIFILVAISFAFSFVYNNFSDKIIAVMLMLIAVEFFISHIIHLEDIEKKLDNLRSLPEDAIVVKHEDNFMEGTNKLLRDAKKEIIIYGGTLSLLRGAGTEQVLKEVAKKNITIRLLVLNIENKEILTRYNELANQSASAPKNLDHLNDFKNKENIEIRTFEILPTSYFIAIDLDKSGGYIKAHHILGGVQEKSTYPIIEIKPSNKYWYDVYRKHIKTLWDNGTTWG